MKMSKVDIEMAAQTKMTSTMCHCGITNARKVLYRAWKLAQQEEKRQKEANACLKNRSVAGVKKNSKPRRSIKRSSIA